MNHTYEDRTYWITDGTYVGIPEDILWLNFPPPDENLGYRLYELSTMFLNLEKVTKDIQMPVAKIAVIIILNLLE